MNLLELQKILGNRIKEEVNSKNLSESEKDLIKDESNFKVKFKIVEWFEKIKSFF